MKPLRFDRSRIQALLQTAGERLAGEWLVIGGAAAAAWFSPSRTTEDIDLISLAGTQEARLALERLSEADLGDCLMMISHCAQTGESIEVERVVARLDSLPSTDDLPLSQRRARLRDALVGPPR